MQRNREVPVQEGLERQGEVLVQMQEGMVRKRLRQPRLQAVKVESVGTMLCNVRPGVPDADSQHSCHVEGKRQEV